ncbi:Alcohol acetyltransferase [[Candida] zeylanoides]
MASREPGFLERQYICRNTNGYWTNINVVAKYSRNVDRHSLARALRKLCLAEPWLVLNFFRIPGTDGQDRSCNGKNYIVRPVSKFALDDVVSFEELSQGGIDGAELGRVNDLVCPMNAELPLWRIIVYESDEQQRVGIYFDHSLFDGVAAANFHRDLIRYLSEDNGTGEEEDYIFDSAGAKVNIPPAREVLWGLFDTPWWFRAKLRLGQLWSKALAIIFGSPNVFKYLEVTPNVSSEYAMLKFGSSDARRIAAHCKHHGITITPFLNAVGLQALQTSVIDKVAPTTTATLSCIPINGRRYVSDAASTAYGVYTGYDNYLFGRVQSVMDTAKALSRKLASAVKSKSGFKNVGMYRFINIWDAYASKLHKREGRVSLVTSNLGKVDAAASAGWSIEDIWFSSCLGLVTHFLINAVGSPNGDLNVVVGCLPEYKEHLQGYVDEFRHTIETILKS